MDLARAAAYSDKTPYDLWQELEKIPIVRGHCVEDLSAVHVTPWARTGVLGAFVGCVASARAVNWQGYWLTVAGIGEH